MQRPLYAALTLGFLAGCQTTTDPAEGGFFNGVSGITSGAYEDRVAAGEADVASAQARNDALAAQQSALASQIKSSESELAGLKFRILQQRDALGTTDSATAARIDRVLNAKPTGATADAKLAALQQTISQARALSADLAKLSG
jgi:chromosome segregation ATPase